MESFSNTDAEAASGNTDHNLIVELPGEAQGYMACVSYLKVFYRSTTLTMTLARNNFYIALLYETQINGKLILKDGLKLLKANLC